MGHTRNSRETRHADLSRDGLRPRETLGKCDSDLGVHLVDRRRRIDLDNLALFSVLVDNGHGGLDECSESLDDGLSVIVCSARGLAPLEQAAEHDLFGGGEEEDEGGLADLGLGWAGRETRRARWCDGGMRMA